MEATCAAGVVGTPCTMAPETMMGAPYTAAADVYSFGVLLWELYTGRVPWAGRRPVQIMYAVVVSGASLDVRDADGVPPAVLALMRACWAADPLARPSLTEILGRLAAVQS